MWDILAAYLSWANIASLLRAGLMALGAGLVTNGNLDPSQLETAVGGLLGFASVVWSYFVHKPKAPTPPTI